MNLDDRYEMNASHSSVTENNMLDLLKRIAVVNSVIPSFQDKILGFLFICLFSLIDNLDFTLAFEVSYSRQSKET